MTNKMKRLTALMLALVMIYSCLPMNVLAEATSGVAGGYSITRSSVPAGTTSDTTLEFVPGGTNQLVVWCSVYNDPVNSFRGMQYFADPSSSKGSDTVDAGNNQPMTYYTLTFKTKDSAQAGNSEVRDFEVYDVSSNSFKKIKITFEIVEASSGGETTSYTVKFNANGGNGTMSDVTVTDANYALPQNQFTRDGYEFKGWATSADGEVLSGNLTLTGETILYAIWEETQTGGSEEGYTTLVGGETIRMTVGETRYFTYHGYNTPGDYANWDANGYFSVSSDAGVEENGGKTYHFSLTALKATSESGVQMRTGGNGKTTFIISDKPAVTYNVTFAAGEGTGEMAAVTAPESYQLPACTFTAPEDYEFAGWDVNGTVYPAGETVTLGADTTITATWKALPAKVKVVFANLQGNTADAVDTRASYSINVPAGLIREGYTFLGWSETEVADLGKTETVSSYINNNYTVSESAADEVILYAVWQAMPTDVTVVFDANGSTDNVADINGE